MESDRFAEMYQGQAPWDIGRPQPIVVELAAAGRFGKRVIDVGCGTGDNAIYLTGLGHEVLGLDYVAVAIERAKAKAAKLGSNAQFIVGNALKLDTLNQQFDTALDCGLFHTFSDEERPTYVLGLAAVVRTGGLLHILCFSDAEPPGEGPRRVSEQELRSAFASGWTTVEIQPTRFAVADVPFSAQFSPGGPKAWRATFERME